MAKKPTLTPEEARQEALKTALETIERKFGQGAVMKLSDDVHVKVPVIPTGSIGVDLALGIGGIALSLGLQDTLSNLIGGLSVSLGRVVEPGQYIEVLSQSGRVTDINWRHTTIVDAGGSTHLIPNSIINKNSLVDIGDSVDARIPFLLPVGADIEAFSNEALMRVKHEFSGQMGPSGARVVFAGEELGGIKGNVVVNVLRTAATAESGADRAFRAMYPVVRKYSAADPVLSE